MSLKAVSWILLAAIAMSAVWLLNYWASYQPLSTLAYSGIVLALCGLANLAFPFRFLGIKKRVVGALILSVGVVLGATALLWPAPMIRTAIQQTHLDEIIPEYQFSERHSKRIHARPEQVMQAIRQATMGDLRSYVTLMKVRAAVLRRQFRENANYQDERVLEVLSSPGSGFIKLGESEQAIVLGGVGNARSKPRPEVNNLQEFAAYTQEGGAKLAFNLRVEDAGDGWSVLSTETRVLALDHFSRRIMGPYWRLIVPGSGLLRREWLDGISKRAEQRT